MQGQETTVRARSAGMKAVRTLAQSHYENFSVASLALPRRLVPHFHAVYAYCRIADDLGDESPNEAAALEGLADWREELLTCYEGTPRHPVMLALRETIQRFAIPREPFLDLISAFEQDQHVKEYQTTEQLLDYCQRSANPVGRIVLRLMECFDEQKALLSDQICTALQLTNFWQDVSRDLDIGRIYLPAEDRRRFGISLDELKTRRFTPAFANLIQFEVEATRALFRDGQALVQQVPREFRVQIDLFARGGLAVLTKIEKAGFNVWNRPALSRLDKAWLIMSALGRRWFG